MNKIAAIFTFIISFITISSLFAKNGQIMKTNYQFFKFTISVILFSVIAIPTIGQKSKKDIVDKSVNYMEIGPDCKRDPIPSDVQFDLQFEYPVGVGDGEAGIETDGSYIYTTKWNGAEFYKYQIDGTYIESFTVSGAYSVRDLAFNGTYFYGGAASTTVFEMDFSGQSLVSSFTAPTNCRAIAYNEDDDAFYANNWGSAITKFDMAGTNLGSFPVGPTGDSYYGFAYQSDTYVFGEGPFLWGYAQIGATLNELVQISLPDGSETGVYFDVASALSGSVTNSAGGLYIADGLVPGFWTIGGMLQNKWLWGLEIGPAGPPPTNDVGVQSIVDPSTGVNLTATELVTIQIINFGTDAQSNFNVSFTLDGGSPVSETITATINGGNTYDHTFATTVDLSVYGTYTFEACTDLVGDEIPGNDCKIKTVENIEPSYCSTSYSNQTDDWISNVTFNTINNSTVAEPGGYGDYTSEITSVEQNLSYDLSADVTVNGSWIQHTWAWIDWNQNYDFTDPGEAYDLGETPGTAGTFTLTANITVPGDALPGLTRMRVAELYNADPEPCSVDVYGEAEDYSVEVIYNTNSSFDLKLFLEGPFLYNQMIPYLNLLGYIPLVQPYNTEPWNYGSNESVGAIPNLDVVDWVLVELRKTTGDVTTATADSTIDMKAGFLLKDGSIVGLDGVNPIQLNTFPSGDMYVVIWHRNHLGVISNFPLIETKGVYSYDFTTNANQAYGDSFVMKKLNTGIWGVMSGDGLNDTKINNEDKNEVWVPQDDNYGYYNGDFNLDGQVNDPDKVVYWEPNSGMSGMVPGGPRTNWVGEFTCGDLLIDSRDGQSYSTVQIGTQCWMAENLNIGTRIDGVNDMTDNSTIEKYCYDDLETNCDTYGGLYQWDEMMQYVATEGTQGICPTDWHLPTDEEWKVLEGTVDSQYGVGDPVWNGGAWRGFDAGKNLKSSSGWINNGNGTNSFGLNILPAGGRGVNGIFIQLGNLVTYSTSTFSWDRQLKSDQEGIWRGHGPDIYGNPVRCIRDDSTQINQPPSQPTNPSPDNGAIDQPVNTTLSWTCTDPENDPLTYDVYFGETNPPALVFSGQTANTYDPGTLNYNITYYWKITAHDDHTNSTEGPIWSFTTVAQTWSCGDDLLDTRDGQTYGTVEIGTQCWMAENLNIGTRIDGVNEMIDNSTIEKYCYDDLETNCDTYGGLYQWDEMMQYTTTQGTQGICPPDWHLPTDEEWKQLEGEVDSQYGYPDPEWNGTGWRGYDAGLNLKSTSGWYSSGNGTDLYAFTALPGGFRYNGGNFSYLGSVGRFRSSTDYDINGAWIRQLSATYNAVRRIIDYKSHGYSVRCLKDETTTNQPPSQPTNPSPDNGAIDQPVNTNLSWTCTDPENDPLTYDVYFGETNPPALVSSGQTANIYDPGTLNYNITYYWKITAHDDHTNSTEGPVWSFTTETEGCGNLQQDLDHYYKLDGDLLDCVGDNNWVNHGSLDTPDGKINHGREFNNGTTNQYCTASSISLSSEASLNFWFYSYQNQPTISGVIFKAYGSPHGDQSIFGAQASGNILNFGCFLNNGSSGGVQYEFDNNTWYHFVWVFDGQSQEARLYVNGIKTTVSLSGTALYNPNSKLKMGMQKYSTRSFHGKLDEIGFWTRALDDNEVSSLYNNGLGNQYPFEN